MHKFVSLTGSSNVRGTKMVPKSVGILARLAQSVKIDAQLRSTLDLCEIEP